MITAPTVTEDTQCTITVEVTDDCNRLNIASEPITILGPGIGVAKAAGAVVDNGDGTFTVPFTIRAEGASTQTLHDVQIVDDLTVEFGTLDAGSVDMPGEYEISTAPVITTNAADPFSLASGASAYDGATNTALLDIAAGGSFAPSEFIEVTFAVTFYPDPAALPITNQAVGSGDTTDDDDTVTTDGIEDLSQNGSDVDPDGDGNPTNNNDVTPVPVTLVEEIGAAKAAGAVVDNGDGTFTVPIAIRVENTGNVILHDVQVEDNLATQFGTYAPGAVDAPGEYELLVGPALATNAGDPFSVNPSFDGTAANAQLLDISAEGSLAVGEFIEITFTARFFP